MKDNDKIKIIITLYANIRTDLENVTKEQIIELFQQDDVYGLKSVVCGKVDNKSVDDIDTDITWDQVDINVIER